ncbi:VCBS domain-containing protein, partial [Rhizobacter sp. Root1221]|uniref:beta strand repeat-containing protein n=1 Tax=Rhizobacter sp. Root1221 TaxID=1736433 RepID=UPI00210085CB
YGSFVVDAGTGVWTYTLDNTHQNLAQDESHTETFTVTVTDDRGATAIQDVILTITGTNDAPAITSAAQSSTVKEDTTLTATGTVASSDVDHGATAAYSGNTTGSYGSFMVDAATGVWTYTLDNTHQNLAQDETHTETFAVTVTDDFGGTAVQNVVLTITGTNDAPVITSTAQSDTVKEDTTLTATGTVASSDVDHGATAAYSGNTTGTYGSFAVDAGTGVWTYTLDNTHQSLAQGESQSETFTVTVTDDKGAVATQDVVLTITGTNDAPVAVVDVNNGNEDASITGTVASNDSDVDDGAVLTYSLNVPVAGLVIATDGNYSFNAGNAAYQHLGLGDTTNVVASYTVTDEHGAANTSTLTITLTGTNDGPIAVVDTNSGVEDTTLTGTLATNDSDADDGASLTYSLNAPVAGLTLAANGSYSFNAANAAYQHLAQGATANVVANYTVTDEHGATSISALTITLTGTNDGPVAVADVAAGTENQTLTIGVLGNDTDVDDGHVFTLNTASAPAGKGTASVVANQVVFTPGSDFDHLAQGAVEHVTLSYEMQDQFGVTSTSTVDVTITGTNDASVLNAAVTPALSSIAEDAGAPSGAVGTLVTSLVDLNPPVAGLNNTSDADDAAVTGIAITGTNSSNGTWWYSANNGVAWTQVGAVSDSSALLLAANANTRLYFQGNSNFNGTVSDGITFRAWDQTSGTAGTKVSTSTNGGTSAFSIATDTASIVVSAVNDNPVAVADRLIVSNNTIVTIAASSLIANDNDIDGFALAITSVGIATGITDLMLDATNGTISFSSGSTVGATAGSFQYTVSDGAGGTTTATATIDIRAVASGNTAETIDLGAAGTYQASYIDGRGGMDRLTGGAAGDIFIGGTGNDDLVGSAGNDFLGGGDGGDALSGGAGNDVLRGGQGNDNIDGGAGTEDLIDFSDAAGAGGITAFTLTQSSSDTTFNTPGTTSLGNDTYRNIEGVIGTTNADILAGSGLNDIIRGGGGNDALDGKAGNDLIDFSDAAAGIAFTLVNNGSGTVFNTGAAGLGSDTYSGFEGVIGTAFADTLTGSASADQLRGGVGNDVINGLAGDDRIVGGAGADTLTGGTDNDTFVFDSAPNAVDSITDFNASGLAASGDLLELSLATFMALTTASGSTLLSSDFASSNGGGAADTVGAAVHVIYDSTTGNLYYDSDGLGAGNRTLVASLTLSSQADTFDYNDIKVGP